MHENSFLTEGSFGKETSVGSNPAGPTKLPTGPSIVSFLFWLKKKGYREATLEGYDDVFRYLARRVDLEDPEAVKAHVAAKHVSEARKQILVDKYARYCEFRQISFEKPIYRAVKRLPFIPTEQEIDALIAGCGRKTSTFLQVLKETGARPGEIFALKWIDVNHAAQLISINNPEKNSLPRVLKISNLMLSMLNALPKHGDYVFKQNPSSRLKRFARNFYDQRLQLSVKLQNPRIRSINLKTFRHWKATMEYHRTKDILHVKQLLGHVNIMNTLVYTHLVNFEPSSYVCKIAIRLEDAQQLIEEGFEYVTDLDGAKLFRKLK